MKIQNVVKILLVAVLMSLLQACAPASKNAMLEQLEERPQELVEVSDEQPQPRSIDDLKDVISANTQDRFRIIYNRFLRTRPGFGGEMELSFEIVPDGSVENASIVSSTTDYDEFDEAILEDLGRWTFESGNFKTAVVTLPFTFYE